MEGIQCPLFSVYMGIVSQASGTWTQQYVPVYDSEFCNVQNLNLGVATAVVRVMPGVTANILHHLPCDGSENVLDLSPVTTRNVEWGCQVAQTLYHKTR